MDIAEAQRIVSSITFRGLFRGVRIELASYGILGDAIRLAMPTVDVETGLETTVHSQSILNVESFSRDALIEFIHVACTRLAVHEMDEAIFVGKLQPFDPHAEEKREREKYMAALQRSAELLYKEGGSYDPAKGIVVSLDEASPLPRRRRPTKTKPAQPWQRSARHQQPAWARRA